MQIKRGATALAAVAVLTGLAACGDDEPTEPTTTVSPIGVDTDTSTSSSSSTSSAGTTPSDSSAGVAPLPEAATERTKEGAIAFNEFFEEQMGEALKTGETGTIEKYSSNCVACDEYVRLTKKDAAKGIKMNVNPNDVRATNATKRDDGGFKVSVTVDASEYHEVLPDGSRGRTAEAVTYRLVTNTQWADGHWVIRNSVRTK